MSEAARSRTPEDDSGRRKKLMADHGFFERRARRLTWVNPLASQYQALCGQYDASPEAIRAIANERRRFGYRRLATLLKGGLKTRSMSPSDKRAIYDKSHTVCSSAMPMFGKVASR